MQSNKGLSIIVVAAMLLPVGIVTIASAQDRDQDAVGLSVGKDSFRAE